MPEPSDHRKAYAQPERTSKYPGTWGTKPIRSISGSCLGMCRRENRDWREIIPGLSTDFIGDLISLAIFRNMPPSHLANYSFSDFSPSFQWVLQACQVFLKGGKEIQNSESTTPNSWNHILEIAQYHKVAPIIQLGLVDWKGKTPENWFHELSAIKKKAALQSLAQAQEMLRLIQAFQARGLNVVPYKGVHWAVSLYGDLGLRRSSDIDLWVPQKEVPRAVALLQDLGYVPGRSASFPDPERFLRHNNELSFYHPEGRRVDLHWQFIEPSMQASLAEAELLRSIVPGDLLGHSIPTFSPEMTLVILTLHHGGKDTWLHLRNVLDLCLLVRNHPDLDWEVVRSQLRKIGMERILFLGLWLGDQLFQLGVPNSVKESIETPSIQRLAIDRLQRWDQPGGIRTSDLQYLRQLLGFHFRTRDRWVDRFGVVFRHLSLIFRPNERDFQFLPLPSWLQGLYIVVKPIRLLRKHLFEKAVS
jgi:hypothetical protein